MADPASTPIEATGPLGTIWNSVAGIVGGGIGGQILGAVMGGDAAASGGLDIGSIIGQTAAGGVGGCVLMAIIGAVKQGHGRRGKPLDTIQHRRGFERAHAADEWS